MEHRLEAMPEAMAFRRCTVEHVFGTIMGWMGASHFRTRGLTHVATKASLAILAYNIKRAIAVAGVASTLSDNGVNGANARNRKPSSATSRGELSHGLDPIADPKVEFGAAESCH